MEKSQSITKLAKALQLFNTKMDKIKKTETNPFFKSKYAALPQILEAISTPLQEAGLTFTQFPDGDSLTTILIHVESGEFMQASYAMHPIKNDPQAVGSAITYARRYALGAILCLNIDEDDDGNKATHTAPPADQSRVATPEAPWLNEKQLEAALGRIKMGEIGVYEKTKATFRIKKEYREQLENAEKFNLQTV